MRAPLARAVRSAARGRGARRDRGAHDLPDAGRRVADRARAALRLHVQGDARGQAQHELARAGRRLGGARAGVLPRALRARGVPRGLRAVRRARRRRGRAARAASDGAQADRPWSARHLPGRRAGGALARRSRQPPPGRLGAAARAARSAAHGPRHAQAVADPRRCWRCARAVRTPSAALTLRSRRAPTRSPSCAARTSWSRCRFAGARSSFTPPPGDWAPVLDQSIAGITVLERG